eukprot:1176258-Prymnesium_polylepis.1
MSRDAPREPLSRGEPGSSSGRGRSMLVHVAEIFAPLGPREKEPRRPPAPPVQLLVEACCPSKRRVVASMPLVDCFRKDARRPVNVEGLPLSREPRFSPREIRDQPPSSPTCGRRRTPPEEARGRQRASRRDRGG